MKARLRIQKPAPANNGIEVFFSFLFLLSDLDRFDSYISISFSDSIYSENNGHTCTPPLTKKKIIRCLGRVAHVLVIFWKAKVKGSYLRLYFRIPIKLPSWIKCQIFIFILKVVGFASGKQRISAEIINIKQNSSFYLLTLYWIRYKTFSNLSLARWITTVFHKKKSGTLLI